MGDPFFPVNYPCEDRMQRRLMSRTIGLNLRCRIGELLIDNRLVVRAFGRQGGLTRDNRLDIGLRDQLRARIPPAFGELNCCLTYFLSTG